ncbi:YetF domain-containing protein [Flavobacterium aquidurense]|uniref:DUF421 domain-containing protein n=1 Tax=Flavobacterium aquidurense TaxID=362413 RepID=UPI0028599335|nr:YetF domain-containing protein [Flavobacterium aquidurense]MDR7370219.1 uncharacterized membrane protein YcaP (DUF421 family) [Flavobacterium aquidurense]
MQEVFFKDWKSIEHVALSTIIAFITLFFFVRISGKRTLSKLNAFDFVVTVALGSTLSYMMLAMVPIVEGTIVLLLIIILQYIFAWTARSSKKMERLINAVPTLIYYDGKFIEKAMAKEAITKGEIFSTIRNSGIDQIDEVKAIVMELNGQITVVRKSNGNGSSSLDDIELADKAVKDA